MTNDNIPNGIKLVAGESNQVTRVPRDIAMTASIIATSGGGDARKLEGAISAALMAERKAGEEWEWAPQARLIIMLFAVLLGGVFGYFTGIAS